MTATTNQAGPAYHAAAPGDVGRRVVELACQAPSVHNSQPWRWRVDGSSVELHADRGRQLAVADPRGRNLVLSCGAALHHARVAAAALGLAAVVERHPDPADPDHLASLHLASRAGTPSAEDLFTLQALQERCTDRRRFTAWPIPDDRLARLAGTVTRPEALAVPLTDVSARFRTELLVRRARTAQDADARLVSEQAGWVGRSAVDGIPSASLPTADSLPTRFAPAPVPPGPAQPGEPEELVETSDGLIVVCSDSDDVRGWLAAGEALSEVWLAATVEGLSVVPLTQVVEVGETRLALRHDVLGGAAEPQLLLRLGWQEIGRSQLVRTSRRPVEEVLVP